MAADPQVVEAGGKFAWGIVKVAAPVLLAIILVLLGILFFRKRSNLATYPPLSSNPTAGEVGRGVAVE